MLKKKKKIVVILKMIFFFKLHILGEPNIQFFAKKKLIQDDLSSVQILGEPYV